MIKINRPECPHPKGLENGNYKHPKNKTALKDASNGKCMYCESDISHIDFAHVEHIKPKAEDKYPELEFVWNNLGYSCAICNNNKSDDYYPHTPYIDPYSEKPSNELFHSGALLFPKNGSERGELSITDIGLNRPELIEKRNEKLKNIEQALKAAYRTKNMALRTAAISELANEALPEKEYSLCIESFLEANNR